MPQYFIEKPWTHEPPQEVDVNLNHPLSRGMILFTQHQRTMPFNAVPAIGVGTGYGRYAQELGSGTTQAHALTPYGLGLTNTDNNEQGPSFIIDGGYINAADGVTIAVLCNPTNASQNFPGVVAIDNTGSTANYVQFLVPRNPTSVQNTVNFYSDESGSSSYSSTDITFDEWNWYMGQMNDQSGGVNLYYNNVLQSMGADTATMLGTNDGNRTRINLGYSGFFTGETYVGDYGTVVIWNRMISESEWFEFLENPWAVLNPQRIPIFSSESVLNTTIEVPLGPLR